MKNALDNEKLQFQVLADLQKFMRENPPKAVATTVAKEGERISGYNVMIVV